MRVCAAGHLSSLPVGRCLTLHRGRTQRLQPRLRESGDPARDAQDAAEPVWGRAVRVGRPAPGSAARSQPSGAGCAGTAPGDRAVPKWRSGSARRTHSRTGHRASCTSGDFRRQGLTPAGTAPAGLRAAMAALRSNRGRRPFVGLFLCCLVQRLSGRIPWRGARGTCQSATQPQKKRQPWLAPMTTPSRPSAGRPLAGGAGMPGIGGPSHFFTSTQ